MPPLKKNCENVQKLFSVNIDKRKERISNFQKKKDVEISAK